MADVDVHNVHGAMANSIDNDYFIVTDFAINHTLEKLRNKALMSKTDCHWFEVAVPKDQLSGNR